MKMSLILAIFMGFLGLLKPDLSLGFFVSEIEPGIIELKGTSLDGSLDSVKTFIDKKKKWIYLEIKEGKDVRYFYARLNDFNKITPQKKIKSIQYGIGNRIQNNKGKIPFGAQRYFYPLLDYKS